MQYGGMHLLRVSGWVAVIIAAPAVLTIGVAAAHRASAPPPRPPRVGGTAPAGNSHPTVAGTDAGGQGLDTGTGVAVDPGLFQPGRVRAFARWRGTGT